MTRTNRILEQVLMERLRQDRKWGPQNHSIPEWVTILAEEFGEAAKAANELWFRPGRSGNVPWEVDHYRRELIQVAAVAVAMVEQLDNGEARVR